MPWKPIGQSCWNCRCSAAVGSILAVAPAAAEAAAHTRRTPATAAAAAAAVAPASAPAPSAPGTMAAGEASLTPRGERRPPPSVRRHPRCRSWTGCCLSWRRPSSSSAAWRPRLLPPSSCSWSTRPSSTTARRLWQPPSSPRGLGRRGWAGTMAVRAEAWS